MNGQFTQAQQEEIVSSLMDLYHRSVTLHRELEAVKAEFDAVPSYVERFAREKRQQSSQEHIHEQVGTRL